MTDAASPVELAPASFQNAATLLPPVGPWLVIRNPFAGRARNRRAWDDFERALRRRGVSFDVCTTACAGDGARLAEAAVHAGIDRILVAGGDGSVHDVLNGLMRARSRDGMNADVPSLAPVPLGTGNDWARSLRLPRDPDRLAALIATAAPAPHDVGVIRFPARGDETRWFVNVAGAGFDAHVISRLPPLTPSRFAYLAGALRELGRYRSPRFRIAAAGASPREGRFLMAFVANGQYCGHRMHVAPPALLDDGRFDVVTVDDLGLLRALPKLLALYFGNVLRDPLVHHETAQWVRIESDPATAVEADGQLVGMTPAEFSVERGALRVLRGA
ncbi:MAG TPA: diacylglycerol kinase family protein [Steroidobacteraceae bacterium]|nr:diacylglycerol kinase family protein [Steroidobacteraceae bacterium]